MSSFLRDDFTLRRGRPEDVPAVTETLVAEERAFRGESEWGTVDTHDWWRGLEDRGEAWIVQRADGDVAAVLGLFQRDDLFDAWISVHPSWSGRGLGSGLLAHVEARVKERAGTHLKIGTLGENDAAHRLLDAAGYRPVRHYFRMTIDLDERPAEPVWPDGITCETFDVAHALAFHEAVTDAFEEEWNFRPMPFEEWKRHRLGAPDFDPTLWFVACDDTEVAGIIRCEPQRWGGGWVGMLGVRRPWRRRGLGLALLQRAFCEFYDRGERRVGLGVDAQNATGATRLYERAGMRVRAKDIIFEKELT